MGMARRGADTRAPLMQRLLWFAGLWTAGVGVVALVGWIIKLMIGGG